MALGRLRRGERRFVQDVADGGGGRGGAVAGGEGGDAPVQGFVGDCCGWVGVLARLVAEGSLDLGVGFW